MINRRGLLLHSLALPARVPAIVRSEHLMAVRTSIRVRPPQRIGLIDRRLIARAVPRIAALQKAGLSADEIAGVLERTRQSEAIRLIEPWSAREVVRTMREAALLRAMDFARRVEG